MPYKSERIKIAGTQFDRRIKLTEEQKELMRWLRDEEKVSYNKLAVQFKVSKRLVIFICNPEKYQEAKEHYKIRRKDGRYKQDKENWADVMKEHRRYKQELYLNNKIRLENE